MNIRYWKPWRRLLVKLCVAIGSVADKIADYLYPDDCVISFGGE